MSAVETARKCSRCGASLPTDAPEGLCPRCLIALNLATQTDVPGEAGPHGTKIIKPPLSPADITKYFPQLEILECLGRGGMGVVYKARQPRLDRLVALKILAPEKENDAHFAERFTREAQALARLSHANIVTVHDFGEADGLYYLVMEFVDGANLRQLIQSRQIVPEEALAIVPKICEALQYAHDQGIVHRDIKPENVLVDKQGRVKIADFGIAKIVGANGRMALTEAQVVGTPHYMAPEQIERPTTVDHRADIYSLGVVFYEMLTGELPLGKFQPPSEKVQIDVRLDKVVLHALEKEPERRYQHASEVKTDVETIAGSAPPLTPKPKSPFVRIFEILAGTSFTSAAAIKTLNASALGFLGFLSALSVLPRMRWCAGFAGLFGLFGLIGVAFIIESASRRRATKKVRAGGSAPASHGGDIPAEHTGERPIERHRVAMVWAILLVILSAAVVAGWFWSDQSFSLLACLAGVFAVTTVVTLSGAWLLSFLRRWLAVPATAPGSSTEIPSSERERIRREVKGPAIGLVVTGILNWLAIPLIFFVTLGMLSQTQHRRGVIMIAIPLAAFVLSCVLILAGLKMKRLEAHALAIAGSVLAILVSPGNVIGLPVGIWALVVLSRRETREAFAREAAFLPARPGQRGRKFALVVLAFVLPIVVAGALLTAGLNHKTKSNAAAPSASASSDAQNSASPQISQTPPVVIQTAPESGTSDVDPALTELRVTFSKQMQDANWSWVKLDDESFPETAGEPHFLDDRRTCVLRVRLKPGKVYAMWLNSESAQEFKDGNGRPAVPYLLIFETKR